MRRAGLLVIAVALVLGGVLQPTAPAVASAAGWRWQNPLPQGNSLGDVDVVDGSRAVAVGDAGTLLRTADGGRSWTSVSSGVTGTLFAVRARQNGQGWAVGADGVILRTGDGGQSWAPLVSGVTQALMDVGVSTVGVVVVVGERGLVLQSRDGGRSWGRRSTRTSHNLHAVTFYGKGKGWAVGDLGTVLHTTDRGRTWDDRGDAVFGTLHDVVNIGDAVLVAASQGTVWRGTNAGRVWKRVRLSTPETVYDLALQGGRRLIAVGGGGSVWTSADAGRTWHRRRQGSELSLLAADFADSRRGLAVGTNGRILRTVTGGASWTRVGSGTSVGLLGLAVEGPLAWATGRDGVVMITGDGVRWKEVRTPVADDLAAVSFRDFRNGAAVGQAGTIIHTADSGASWRLVASPTREDLLDIDLSLDGRGWAVGTAGAVLRTVDGGSAWSSVGGGSDADLRAVASPDERTAVAVGGDPWGQGPAIALRTANAGTTWTATDLDLWGSLEDVAFSTPLNGCAVGVDYGPDGDWASGIILRSVDGGLSWQRVLTASLGLSAIAFADDANGWAAGAFGTMMSTSDGGATWQPMTLPTTAAVNAVVARDLTHVWLAGSGGTILFSSDAAAPHDPSAPLPRRPSITLEDLID